MTTLYEILGVSTDALNAEIRSAFKRRALLVHPDKGGCKEEFQRVMVAFEVISDPQRRTQYDRRLTSLNLPQTASCKKQRKSGLPREAARMEPCKKRSTGDATTKCTEKVRISSATMPLGEEHRKRESRHTHGIARIFQLLQRLPETQRRGLLSRSFTQWQRLALEEWVTTNRTYAQSQARSCSPRVQEGDDDGTRLTRLVPFDGEDSSVIEASLSSESDDGEVDGGQVSAGVLALPWLSSCGSEHRFQSVSEDFEGSSEVSRSKVRGIHTSNCERKNQTYQAVLGVNWVWLTSRTSTDLAATIDHHLVLADIVQRTRANSKAPLSKRLELAIASALADHDKSAKDIGLGIHCRLQKRFWMKGQLYTPTFHSTGIALVAIKRLEPFIGKAHTSAFFLLKEKGIEYMQDNWHQLKKCYLDICEEGGWDRLSVQSKLQMLELTSQAHRQRTMEKWSRWRMKQEDPLLATDRSNRKGATAETRKRRVCILLAKWENRVAKAKCKAKAKSLARAKVEATRAKRAKLREEKENARSRPAFSTLTMDEIMTGKRAFGE